MSGLFGLSGEMPTYRRVMPSLITHPSIATDPGRSRKNQAYTPGSAGTGHGLLSTSSLDHSLSGLMREFMFPAF